MVAARAIDFAGLQSGEVGLDPQRIAAIAGRARRQCKDKADGRAEIARFGRRDLVQTRPRKAGL